MKNKRVKKKNKIKFKSIGAKIKFGFTFILVFFTLIITAQQYLNYYYKKVYTNIIDSLIISTEYRTVINDSALKFSQMSIDNINDTKAYKNNLTEDINNLYVKLDKSVSNESTKGRINVNSIKNLTDSYLKKIDSIINSLEEKNVRKSLENIGEAKKNAIYIDNEVSNLIKNELQYDEIVSKDINVKFNKIFVFTIAIIFIIISFSIVYASYITRYISKALKKLTEISMIIGEGDLTCSDVIVESSDELNILGNSFNNMKNNLRDITNKIKNISSDVSDYSDKVHASVKQNYEVNDQISQVIQDISENAEKQAANMNNTSQIVQKELEVMNDIAESVKGVLNLSEVSKNTSKEGAEIVSNFIEQINNINESIEISAKSVEELNEKSNQISSMIELITNISKQTNLLALNAAIEAARAGEFGKGFAVVAEEVRKLAEESSNAANQITTEVQSIQNQTMQITKSINNSVQQVNDGMELIKTTKTTFNNIEVSSNEVNIEIEKISLRTKSLLDSITNIEKDIEKSYKITQNFAASSEEIAASTEEQMSSLEEMLNTAKSLNDSSVNMIEVIKSFKL